MSFSLPITSIVLSQVFTWNGFDLRLPLTGGITAQLRGTGATSCQERDTAPTAGLQGTSLALVTQAVHELKGNAFIGQRYRDSCVQKGFLSPCLLRYI